MKVAEQHEQLQQHPLCIAAGTPNRLCKLADMEALQLGQLQLVLLDVHQDAKKRQAYQGQAMLTNSLYRLFDLLASWLA